MTGLIAHVRSRLPLMLLCGLAGACSAAGPTPAQEAEVAAYGASQLICVQASPSKAQADICRGAVKAYWCGPAGALRDAGACFYVPPAAQPSVYVFGIDGGKDQ